MNHRSICILGGAGFVGRALAARLAADGRRVLVPTRHRERARSLLVLPTVEVVEADIHDDAALRACFAGCDAVINLVGILHETRWASFQRVHVDLPGRIARLCRERGIRRLLHMSALGANAASASAYQRTKAAGEAALLGVPDLDVTRFRPSVIFGRGDSFLSLFARLARLAPVMPLANADARFQPVWVEDVARAFASSLDAPASFGQAYNLCGPKAYTLQALVAYAARLAGAQPRIVSLSEKLSYLQALILEKLPGPALMTRDNHYAMRQANVCEAGFPEVFGFQPAALEAIAPGYLTQPAGGEYGGFRSSAGR
jgi:NADH dehydrogenase